jgi:hypothetical protein
VRGQALLLARAQGAGHVHDGVAARRLAAPRQLAQHLLGQRARAGAELPDLVRAGVPQGLGHRVRQRLAEQGDSSGAVTKSLPSRASWPNLREPWA